MYIIIELYIIIRIKIWLKFVQERFLYLAETIDNTIVHAKSMSQQMHDRYFFDAVIVSNFGKPGHMLNKLIVQRNQSLFVELHRCSCRK